MKHKLLYSLSERVLPPPAHDAESDKHSVISLTVSPLRSSDIPNSRMMSSSASQSKEKNIFLQYESGSNPQQELSGLKIVIVCKNIELIIPA